MQTGGETMLSKKQREELLYSLSSFYRDFLPVDNQLLKLYDIYAKTINYAWDVFGEAEDSRFISTTRTLSNIPYFKVSINEAVYDLNTARMLSYMGFEEQIAYLEKEKKYASFVFNNKDAAGDPSVYGMRLFVDFSDAEPLKLYQDYFLRSNKLYLLPSYIQRKRKAVHYLHAYDVKVNDYTLEKNFGTRFNLEAGPLLPRYEYRDVLEAYLRAFQGDMTIRSLKESIKLATKWDDFRVEDMKSPTISKRKLKLYEDWIISPNKFLVSLPEELISDKIKINIIRALMSEIKEADKDYMVFFDINRIDPYALPMKHISKVRQLKGETLTPADDLPFNMVKLTAKEYPLDVTSRYDTLFFYNLNMQYDDPPANEVVSVKLNRKPIVENATPAEDVSVTHNKYVIPRNFTMHNTVDAAGSNDLYFTVSSSSEPNVQFELYGSMLEFGPYELVETLPNDPSIPTLTFEHNAAQTSNLFYKARAVYQNQPSLFTFTQKVNDLLVVILFNDKDLIDENYMLDDSHVFKDTDGTDTLLSYLFNLNSSAGEEAWFEDEQVLDDGYALDDTHSLDDTAEIEALLTYVLGATTTKNLIRLDGDNVLDDEYQLDSTHFLDDTAGTDDFMAYVLDSTIYI